MTDEKKDEKDSEGSVQGGEERQDPSSPPGGRIVSFGAQMKPFGRFQLLDPAARTSREAEPLTEKELQRGTQGGIILMRIMTMSIEDRKAQASSQVDDPLFMWFSFLSPEERRYFLKAAEGNLKESLME